MVPGGSWDPVGRTGVETIQAEIEEESPETRKNLLRQPTAASTPLKGDVMEKYQTVSAFSLDSTCLSGIC